MQNNKVPREVDGVPFSPPLKGSLATGNKTFKGILFEPHRVLLRTILRKLMDRDINHRIVFNHGIFFPRQKFLSNLLVFKSSVSQPFHSHEWYQHLFQMVTQLYHCFLTVHSNLPDCEYRFYRMLSSHLGGVAQLAGALSCNQKVGLTYSRMF